MPKKKTHQHNEAKIFKIALIIFCVIVFILGETVYLAVKSHYICANSLSCIKDLTGKKSPNNKGIFMGKTVMAPQLPNTLDKATKVLGVSTGATKHIYVSLNAQHLYAYQGNNLVFSFPISSGKWHPTPVGDFHIWVWLRYTRMAGGDPAKGTAYDLPNVPFTMYFYNDSVPKESGFSLHGTYWHNNFGHPMSHGCVNLSTADAQQLYYWTNPFASSVTYPTSDNPGTLITIYGNPPASETSFID